MSITEVILFWLLEFTFVLMVISGLMLADKIKKLDKKIEEVKNMPIQIQYGYEEESRF